MSDTVQTAATQPEQVAQIVVEKKGAQQSDNEFAKRIAAKQVVNTFQNAVVDAPKPEAKAPAQETQEVPAPEETKEVAEAPAETTTEESEEVPSHENNTLDPKLQEILNKRIGKEVAKREKLKAQIAELQSKLSQQPAEVEKEVPVPIPANIPLAEYDTPEKLSAYREALRNDIIEAEGLMWSDFPQGGLPTKWGTVSKAQLAAMITEGKKIEATQIPAREQFLTKRFQAKQTASEEFPFLADPTHPGYQMAQTARKDPANAVLRAFPNSEYLIGLLVEGQLALQARKSASGVKTPTKPKPKPTGGQAEITSDASITRAPIGVLKEQALATEVAGIVGTKKGLGHKDFAQILAAKQRYRNSQ